MKLCPMRFASYTWHHNPVALTIKGEKDIVNIKIPYSDDVMKNFGEKLVTISGKAQLYGKDCLKQYEKLKEIYEEKGECGVLCIPHLRPIYACFDTLKLEADTKADVLDYSFSFTQCKASQKPYIKKKSVVAFKNQNMWDISKEHGVLIDSLIEKNPNVMFINDSLEGEIIRLC